MFGPAEQQREANQQPTQQRNTRYENVMMKINERSIETHHPERPSSSFEGSFQLGFLNYLNIFLY